LTISCTFSAMRNTDGSLIGIISINRNITDLVQTTEALRASEERFSRIFQASPVAIAISSRVDGRLLEVNDAFLTLIGYYKQEVINFTCDSLGVWVDQRERDRMFSLLRTGQAMREAEAWFTNRVGEIREVLVSVEPIEPDDEPCALVMFQDITARKSAERA